MSIIIGSSHGQNILLISACWQLRKVFLFCVFDLAGIFIDDLANLENVVANLLGNLKNFRGDLQISFFEFLTTLLILC